MPASAVDIQLRDNLRRERWSRVRRMRLLYLSMLPALLLLLVFNYLPMYGIVIAFKNFQASRGILGSPWNNFENFEFLFGSFQFQRVMRNTVIISLQRIVFGFPAPILLALVINEFANSWWKKGIQSITYLPHFISWVVMAGILVEILSPQRGIIGYLYTVLGRDAPLLLTNQNVFRPILIATDVWKEVGWGSVIYLAAISSIDPTMYDVARIDGAGRVRQATAITLPSLLPVITILFILRLSYILDAGFEQVFNLYNPLVYEVADIIDTYVYRVGILSQEFEFATAAGLFKNVVGVALIVLVNAVIRRFSDHGIW
ncbi:MAG: ABC transporter permease subunit [Spirochaetaceae bacterium]|nr:ABC transporter permease subunit [Spirochaetaceae bacterium]